MTSEKDTPYSNPKEARKKLEFIEDTGKATQKKTNLLNLPYSDLDEEPEK